MRNRAAVLHTRVRSLMTTLLLAALCACGDGGDAGGDTTTPTPSAQLRITAPGTPTGTSTIVTVTSAGGAASAAGVTVQVPAGAFAADTLLTLQPVTNPVQEGATALRLSSSEPLRKPLIVTMPIDADDSFPEGLGLAAQEADGSWVTLLPVTVDRDAGTLSAPLPVEFETPVSGRAAGREAALANMETGRILDLKHVIKFKASYLVPARAKVRTGRTVKFVPYAETVEVLSRSQCPPTGMEDLAPVCAKLTVAYPYTNDKAGYLRSWSVNGIAGGDAASVGTISPDSLAGATYTAPKRKPEPDTVTVTFRSQSTTAADQRVDLSASVKIIDDPIQTYVGDIDFTGRLPGDTTFDGRGTLTWTLDADGHLSGDLSRYSGSGTMVASLTLPGCDTTRAPVPARGALVVFDETRGGTGDPFARKHWFTLQPDGIVTTTARCGTPRRDQLVAMTFNVFTACGNDPTLATAPYYDDVSLLDKTGTWTCQSVTSQATYRFEAR